jgi:membrane peptidoglycan carboxypeptidase
MSYPRSGKVGFRKWLPSWKFVLGGFVTVILAGVALFAAAVLVFPVPQPNDVAVAESTKVLYADGKREIGRLGDIRRTCVDLDQVPQETQQAILAAEDRGFYEHGGFSLEGISRAVVNNVTGGSTQGGSTITQQYVKNAYLTQEQSILRKAKELVLAMKMETIESKDEILENYTCTIYWGRGGYGVQSAAELYFGTDAKDLNLNQSVALAAIIRSPGNYEPTEYKAQLKERMDYVVEGMVEKGWITQEEASPVSMPKFIKKQRGNSLSGQTGYLLESVRQEMTEVGWSEAEIEGGGLTITTTIDKQAQDAAVEAVNTAGPQYDDEGVRVGLAAVEPGTGQIKAIYGGKDYLKDQLNNAMQARSQAGSIFKPYALAAAIEEGYSLGSTWNGSSPATIEGYTLQNYGNSSFGTVSLLGATTNSVNTAYVGVEAAVGVEQTIDAAKRSGLPKNTPGIEENLTFVLGTASPRPIDMASSFATFASRGIQAPPTMLKKVERGDGETAYRIAERGERVFEEETMDQVNTALQSVVNSGTATRASWIGRPAAGKTGTTDGTKSAWFVGYTPQLATSVMLTREDKKGNPISLAGVGGVGNITGGSFPTAIWAEFTKLALEGVPAEPFQTSAIPGFSGGYDSGATDNTPYEPTPSSSDDGTPSQIPSREPQTQNPSTTPATPSQTPPQTPVQVPTSQPLNSP